MMSKTIVILAVAALIGSTAYAITSYRNYESAKEYDEKMCIAVYKNQCVNEVCLTSEERDCQDKCLEGAKAKCDQEGYKKPTYQHSF